MEFTVVRKPARMVIATKIACSRSRIHTQSLAIGSIKGMGLLRLIRF